MAQEERIKGRPRRDVGRTTYYDTELHALLVERLPQFADRGRIIVAKLAKAMDYSAFAVYKTLAENRLSPRAINRILEIDNEGKAPGDARLTKDDLLKFLLN